MEDILRLGGKYNSVRFQLAAQVCLYMLFVVLVACVTVCVEYCFV